MSNTFNFESDYFRDIGLLGNGNYGTVHLCLRLHNNQKVVVKQIRTNLTGEQLKHAKNEVQILQRVHHPNIITFFNSYAKKNSVYIIMEYATSGSLYDLISKTRPDYFEAQDVINYFSQILMGLDHIHSKKIIHRDLKCENIFLTGYTGNVVKIGDFGVSKILTNGTRASTIIGTYNYLAPEVCNGKPYDEKSDIWALGCVLYELCAMQKLFDGPVKLMVDCILNGVKKSIDVQRFGYQIKAIIDICVRVDPSDRPSTKELMLLPDIFPSMYMLGTNLGCLPPTRANLVAKANQSALEKESSNILNEKITESMVEDITDKYIDKVGYVTEESAKSVEDLSESASIVITGDGGWELHCVAGNDMENEKMLAKNIYQKNYPCNITNHPEENTKYSGDANTKPLVSNAHPPPTTPNVDHQQFTQFYDPQGHYYYMGNVNYQLGCPNQNLNYSCPYMGYQSPVYTNRYINPMPPASVGHNPQKPQNRNLGRHGHYKRHSSYAGSSYNNRGIKN